MGHSINQKHIQTELKVMKKTLFLLAFLTFVSSGITGDASYENCMSCHDSDTGTDTTLYPAINISSFGVHRDINTTDGAGNLSNGDCSVCHYNIQICSHRVFPLPHINARIAM
jgi:hypothetical protein